MILVDTSVWVDHLRLGVPALAALLDSGRARMHPFVIGELACGNLRNRREVLALLDRLPATPVATQAEVVPFIERHSLMGRGVGFIDVHLLASAMLGQVRLWTRDRRLAEVAAEMGIGHEGAP
jgi:predicted nucleic acid-binding protein